MLKCRACEGKDREIARLQKQNDRLLDRVLILAERPEAVTEAIEPAVDYPKPETEPDEGPSEAEVNRDFHEQAQAEVDRLAAIHGIPPSAMHDI